MELQKYFDKGFERRRYKEKTFSGTDEEYNKSLEQSSTVYAGGFPEKFNEERVWHLFLIIAPIKRIVAGINANTRTGCGFYFVEYENSNDANNATIFFKNFYVDGFSIKVDKDLGFIEGRQYGRGMYGGTAKMDAKKRRRF